MTKDSIHQSLESAGRLIPDFDDLRIRVAERGIFWAKLSQQVLPTVTPEAAEKWNEESPGDMDTMIANWRAGKGHVTPEQVAQWSGTELPMPERGQDPQRITTDQIDKGMAQLMRTQRGQSAKPAPHGYAHFQPAPKAPPVAPAAPAKPAIPNFDLRQTMDSPTGILQQPTYTAGPGDPNYVPPEPELNYTPGPNDPNFSGASNNVQSLLKAADYLSKKKSNN